MKKIFSALLALVMLMGAVFMLASCGAKPELDLEEAKKNLEDKGYHVTYVKEYKEDPSINASLSASKTEGKETYYITIYEYEDSAIAKLAYESKEQSYDYQREQLELQIKYYKKLLKIYEDELKSDEIDELNDDLKDLEEELEKFDDEHVIGRSGKFVWYGDKAAVDATKGK